MINFPSNTIKHLILQREGDKVEGMIGVVVAVLAAVISIVGSIVYQVSEVSDDVVKDDISRDTFDLNNRRKLIDFGSVVNDLSETPLIHYKNKGRGEDLI